MLSMARRASGNLLEDTIFQNPNVFGIKTLVGFVKGGIVEQIRALVAILILLIIASALIPLVGVDIRGSIIVSVALLLTMKISWIPQETQ